MRARINVLYTQLSKIEGYFPVLVFAITILFQTILFYLGLNFVWNPVKQTIYAIAVVVYFIASLFYIVMRIRDNVYSKSILVKCSLFIGIMGFLLLSSFISFGISSQTIRFFGQFILFCVPAALWGMNFGTHLRGKDFFLHVERAGIVMLPITVMYISQTFLNVSPFIYLSIGAIEYLTFGYGLTPFFFASVINFASNETVFTYVARLSRIRCSQIIRPVAILIYWTGIVFASGRGAIFSSVFFLGFMIAYLTIKRVICTRVIVIGVCCVTILLAFQLISIERDSNRFSYIVDSIQAGDFSTANEDKIVRQSINELIKSETIPARTTDPSDPIATEVDLSVVKGLIVDRGSLYLLAWGEAKDKPFTGLLPLGFITKYGTYPHNALLEILSDLGFIVGGVIILFLAICVIKLIFFLGSGTKETAYMIIFLVGMSTSLMSSGSVWNAPVLCFCVCLSIAANRKKHTKIVSESRII